MLTNIWRRITDCSAPVTVNPDGIDVFDASYLCLSCPFNLAAATLDADTLDISSESTSPQGLSFSSDGLYMYYDERSTETIYQYDLTVAWDLTTGSYSGNSKSVSAQDSQSTAVAFSFDGTKMYMLGDSNNAVFQYTLSTAWDVSTASYDSVTFSVASESTNVTDIEFSLDGTKMYFLGNADIFQYTLATPWDLSTASYDSVTFDTGSESVSPEGLAISEDGTKMYTAQYGSEDPSYIYQYNFGTAWDLSTLTYSSISLEITDDVNNPSGIAVSKDANCTKLYILDIGDDIVHQFS